MLRSTLLVTLAIAAGALPAQATTSHDREIVTATVSYHALNLADPTGQTTLDRRIKRAARRMCASSNSLGAAVIASEFRCRREAIASARPQRDFAIATAVRRQRLAGASLALRSAR